MKTAIVTGGSRGIGAHLALALAEAGWFVVVLGRSRQSLAAVAESLEAAERPHMAVVCDVSDAAAVDDMVSTVQQARPSIDLVVNNAGLIEDEVPIWEADVDQWWQVMVTNVRGPFLVTRAVAPIMIEQGGGRFINMNSGAATRADPVLSAYTASKSALARITGATADAGAEHGIRAFDLAPGVIKTDMTLAMAAHAGRTEWTDPKDVTDLAVAIAAGELDAFSGRMVRAGSDDLDTLRAKASQGLSDGSRMIRLRPWGDDDPMA
ncbi:MAG: SDR family oxidoreductase [Ornithinimicrobium sp.]